MEKGLNGEFRILADPIAEVPEHTIYRFSWQAE